MYLILTPGRKKKSKHKTKYWNTHFRNNNQSIVISWRLLKEREKLNRKHVNISSDSRTPPLFLVNVLLCEHLYLYIFISGVRSVNPTLCFAPLYTRDAFLSNIYFIHPLHTHSAPRARASNAFKITNN